MADIHLNVAEYGYHATAAVMMIIRGINIFNSKRRRFFILLFLISFILVITNLHLSLSSLVRRNKAEHLSLDYNIFLENESGAAAVVQVSEEYQTQICKRPKLSLLNDAIKHAFHKMDPLNCTGYKLFYLEDGILRMNHSVLHEKINSTDKKNLNSVERSNVIEKCEYLGIERVNDDYPVYTESIVKTSEPFDIIIKHDFIRVQCKLNKTDNVELKESFQTIRNLSKSAYKSEVQEISKRIGELEQRSQKDEEKTGKQLGQNRKLLSHSVDTYQDIEDKIRQHMLLQKESPVKINHSKRKDFLTEDDGILRKDFPSQNSKEKLQNAQAFHVRKLANYEHDHGVDQNVIQDDGKEANDRYMIYGDHYPDGEFKQNHGRDYDYDSMMDTGPENDVDFDQFLVQVSPKESVFSRISEILSENMVTKKGMNVLMIGLDSLSNLAFQRKLPLTYRYLKNILEAVILHGYNIVGDATTAALVPILSNQYPLIWNLFKERGYVTLFAEDEPSIGTFNLRLNGFDEKPTDHYMRPFWQSLWASSLREASPRYCTGATPNHIFMLDYLKDFFVKYNNVSKFAFGFMSELTHWDNNPGEYLDQDLLNFLKLFKSSRYLDDTLLIMMSDHGARYSRVRHTVQGKMEERLPFMSFVFPRSFKKKYSHLMKNLKINSNRLTTPFDIHETLQDVLEIMRTRMRPAPNQRGISLFHEIPLNRTCRSAHIDMHWCTCLSRRDLNTDNLLVKKCANSVLHQINQWTEPVREHCTKLQIKRIVSAHLIIPNEKEMKLDVAHYQLTMETYPNKGIYEATILVNFKEGSLHVYPDISRLTKYGNQPACIQKRYPDLQFLISDGNLLHYKKSIQSISF
ncbi:hypothetical protein KUTeg_012064 [Tegillarca granosa]|uniref:Uncharacterized protein n=1 Tax=Tegillarca granosa TaxID=220873 RepID=A0ABQ9EYP2_TEGGR|nr:hypothetical protein KUTeg_012064 [Tegillarca granosa]